jgi:hypothetical protein
VSGAHACRAAIVAALVGAGLLTAASASARDAELDRRVRELKTLQREILFGGTARRIEIRKRLAARALRAHGLRRETPRDHREALGPQGGAGPAAGMTSSIAGVVPVNRRIAPSSQPFTTQSEVSVAGYGGSLLAVWNDAGTHGGVPNNINFSTSTDAGRTWVEGGPLPVGGPVAVWVSDPVASVDAKRGEFYVAGLVIANPVANAVAVLRGRFGPGGFTWDSPRLARVMRDTFPDKPWLAADSSNGNVYVTYTTFFRRNGKNSDFIDFQRSEDGTQTWSPPLQVSPPAEDGLVQGSRPAVGPSGELHVVWKTIDTTVTAGGLDAMRIRTSRDGGRAFGETATVARLYTNFCSGPPGFDRGFGLGFPALAIDRTSGPHRGRVYVGWEESFDFYDDPVGTGDDGQEVEPDGRPSQATPFTIGQTIRGEIAPALDVDWFRFHGERGQTAILELDSLTSRLDVAFRLWCVDGRTRLAYSTSVNVRTRIVLYTLDKSGDYFVSIAPFNDTTGTYRMRTGWGARGAERGRDQRDVFVSHSDDGTSWSAPERIGDDAAGFDDWLPELVVGADGAACAAWYDWRDGDPSDCGAASSLRLARLDEASGAWSPAGVISEVPTLWSEVSSNQAPNMGDYLGLLADEVGVHPAWADGREGDPDVFAAFLPLPQTARRILPLGAEPGMGGVVVRWKVPGNLPVIATLYRRASGEAAEVALGELESEENGELAYFDVDLEPGYRYRYRLGVRTTEGETRVGEQIVDAPGVGGASLVIERLAPNPSDGAFHVAFRRPGVAPARIDVLDLAGRRVAGVDLGQEYGPRGVVDLSRARLAPGVYVVRLVEAGRSVSAKAVVFR